MNVEPSGQACGATVTGVDLTQPLSKDEASAIRSAWLTHHVLAFPEQPMTDDDLERFSLCFGQFGDDPFIAPIEGREHVIAVCRDANETAPLFAETWHSDWSFLDSPPVATCLLGLTIPPVGGDTLFANQHLAYDRLPDDLKSRLEGLVAKHSDRFIYGKGSMHDPASDETAGQTMTIRGDRDPYDGQHPLVRIHEGNGRPALFSTLGYVQGVVDMEDDEARSLLREIHEHQIDDAVIYRHRWELDMAVVWDNRSVLHRATGGYEGHDRLLRRTTIVR